MAGLELRAMAIPQEGKSDQAQAVLLRVDLNTLTLRVLYDPRDPATVSTWQSSSRALALINAGFFQPDFQPAGLLITDGQAYGVSFDRNGTPLEGYEGTFTYGVDGAAIRSLVEHPYEPDEPVDQAVQAFPMLIMGGLPAAFDLPDRIAWRTVVAVDDKRRVILINVSAGEVTLYRLRDWLASQQADLRIVDALNLDGGPSSGMAVNAGRWALRLDSFSRVPSVIAVYQK